MATGQSLPFKKKRLAREFSTPILFLVNPEKPWKFIEIEIGGKDSTGFSPQHKIKYWNDDANVSMRLIVPGDGLSLISSEGNFTEWSKGDIKIIWEHLGEAVDQKVYLASKPEGGKVQFALEHKNVIFAYQHHNVIGADRPENVMGSYALYHSSKANCAIPISVYKELQTYLGKEDVTGADLTTALCEKFKIYNYQSGKIDHWFRRKVISADGVSHLCNMHINKERTILTYFMPSETVYPAVLD